MFERGAVCGESPACEAQRGFIYRAEAGGEGGLDGVVPGIVGQSSADGAQQCGDDVDVSVFSLKFRCAEAGVRYELLMRHMNRRGVLGE